MCSLLWIQRGVVSAAVYGDPFVTTLTYIRGCTAQEQYVVPKNYPIQSLMHQVSPKEAGCDRNDTVPFQNKSF